MGKEVFELKKERNKQLHKEVGKINKELSEEIKRRLEEIIFGEYIL